MSATKTAWRVFSRKKEKYSEVMRNSSQYSFLQYIKHKGWNSFGPDGGTIFAISKKKKVSWSFTEVDKRRTHHYSKAAEKQTSRLI